MIKIATDKCGGCGTCEAVCPSVFKLNPDTFKSEVLDAESSAPCVQDAIDMCPNQAISRE